MAQSETPRRAEARRLRDGTRRLILAHGALDDTERPCGSPLPVQHAYALIELVSNGPMTVSTLAECLSIDRTNVSRLCAKMEARGEIIRTTHPGDGRARLVRLTERGETAARLVDSSSAAHFERIIGSLETDAHRVVEALFDLVTAIHTTTTAPTPGATSTSASEPETQA